MTLYDKQTVFILYLIKQCIFVKVMYNPHAGEPKGEVVVNTVIQRTSVLIVI